MKRADFACADHRPRAARGRETWRKVRRLDTADRFTQRYAKAERVDVVLSRGTDLVSRETRLAEVASSSVTRPVDPGDAIDSASRGCGASSRARASSLPASSSIPNVPFLLLTAIRSARSRRGVGGPASRTRVRFRRRRIGACGPRCRRRPQKNARQAPNSQRP